jgi:hypothetical protein
MPEPPFDLAAAHRWFAIELNNLAWDLVESDARAPSDCERMIHAAHASCYHWLEVGTPLNHQRAQCLLATAYAAAGIGEAAVRHAQRCLELSGENGESQTPFDVATAHGCAARAYAIFGNREKAVQHHSVAIEHVARLDHAEERAVFEKLYPARLL